MNVWSSRTGGALTGNFADFSQSIDDDLPFLAHDIQGSIAHVQGLVKASLLTPAEGEQLIAGLQQILADHEAGQWTMDPALEDVHMNIEATLTGRLGDLGKRLHTGRSRNDQVATCIALYSRDGLQRLAANALALSQALAKQAEALNAAPWVATTHGQPAQPATLGFLLAGHAWRLHDAATQALDLAAGLRSPLGSGAVAGSTLPLDPAYTAAILDLQPPVNALLATGNRDQVLQTLQMTTWLGHAVASLCEDLFGLFNDGIIRIAPQFTTGSSLMPQKRNPDAIELVRGMCRSLIGHEHAVQAVCHGMGLGYVRDYQVVKPHLSDALEKANASLGIIVDVVHSITPTGATAAATGIGATDAAEALVATGIPFRDAYTLVAAAHAEGTNPVEHLSQADIAADAKAAAIEALVGNVELRDTLGGPAPAAVIASLQQLHGANDALQAQLATDAPLVIA